MPASTSEAEAELRRRWHGLAGAATSGVSGTLGVISDHVIGEIIARHAEPHRRHHTATHVMWVLRHIDQLVRHEAAFDVDAVIVAALFHDVIYDPRSSTNEHDSALFASAALGRLGWSTSTTSTVAALIEATAHLANQRATGHDLQRRVLLDADLAILGAPTPAYDRYVAAVRAEHAHVSPTQWREGRSAVLRSFLDRDRIFETHTMFQQRERQGRINLAAELQALTSPRPQAVPTVPPL